jgi:LPXTG-motif cell wall-anchored protein
MSRSRVMSRVVLAMGILVCLWAVGASAQTTTSSATETKAFEVITVQGNTLVVTLPEGTREITVPDDFRFMIDGKAMSVHELKPGMKGTAQITTKTTVTPVTVTEVKNGTVVLKSGGTVIVRTDTDVKAFSQADIDKRGISLSRAGKPATLADFREGDRLTATIVTSKPPRVITEKEVQAMLAKAAPAPAPAAAPPAPRISQAPPPQPAPASQQQASARTLPKTASSMPLVGISGGAFLAVALALTIRRRRQSD